jgi:hypothetical protein
MKNATDVANKWANNLAQATTSIQQGVQAVTTAPTQLAAQAQTAYLAGVQKAVSSGKWANALQKVSLADWQQAMIQKGIPRIASGAAGAKGKFANFMQQFLPWVQQGQQQLATMPRGTLEQNIQRAVFMMTHNAQFQRQ